MRYILKIGHFNYYRCRLSKRIVFSRRDQKALRSFTGITALWREAFRDRIAESFHWFCKTLSKAAFELPHTSSRISEGTPIFWQLSKRSFSERG